MFVLALHAVPVHGATIKPDCLHAHLSDQPEETKLNYAGIVFNRPRSKDWPHPEAWPENSFGGVFQFQEVSVGHGRGVRVSFERVQYFCILQFSSGGLTRKSPYTPMPHHGEFFLFMVLIGR